MTVGRWCLPRCAAARYPTNNAFSGFSRIYAGASLHAYSAPRHHCGLYTACTAHFHGSCRFACGERRRAAFDTGLRVQSPRCSRYARYALHQLRLHNVDHARLDALLLVTCAVDNSSGSLHRSCAMCYRSLLLTRHISLVLAAFDGSVWFAAAGTFVLVQRQTFAGGRGWVVARRTASLVADAFRSLLLRHRCLHRYAPPAPRYRALDVDRWPDWLDPTTPLAVAAMTVHCGYPLVDWWRNCATRCLR